jgi:transposase
VWLLNPYFVKQMPGRKTHTADCVWVAQLLKEGMQRASFIPPAEIRELRDLTRLRAARVEHAVKVGNELRQALEKAHIELDSVVSNLLGLSGRAILAVANSLIQAIRHLLTRRVAYTEPGIFKKGSAVHAPTACK